MSFDLVTAASAAPVKLPQKKGAGASTEEPGIAEVTAFTCDTSLEGEASILVDLVAQSLARDFDDKVLLVTPARDADGGEPDPREGPDRVFRQSVGASSWRASLARHAARFDHIFLDLSCGHFHPDLAEPAPTAVRLSRLAAPPSAGPRRDVHVRLGAPPPSRVPVGSSRKLTALASAIEPRPLSDVRIEPATDARLRDTCAVTFPMRALLKRERRPDGRVDLSALPATTEGRSMGEQVAAVARCISRRQVGVALGAGGALGFAHVALLQELRAASIPIDMVSGASFGSAVGAYYCASPTDGLERLCDARSALRRALALASLSSVFVAAYISASLGCPYIEDLPIRFLPVTTNIDSGTAEVITGGPLGFGLRASGAFPGISTPATLPGRRYVDGCIAANVPTCALASRGAELVVASHVIPMPPQRHAGEPRFPGAVGRLLFELDPIRRTRDALRAPLVAFYHAGEAQSSKASVQFTFAPDVALASLWEMNNAPLILELAKKELDAQGTIQKVKAAYRDLRGAKRPPP